MARVVSAMNERGVDSGYGLDRSYDPDVRKMVKAVVGDILNSAVGPTVSRSSEAASVRGITTAGLLLGHV